MVANSKQAAFSLEHIIQDCRFGQRQDVEQELEFVAFEAAEVYRFLMQLSRHAETLGRRLAVVANQSYGELAILPIKRLLEQEGVETFLFRIPSCIRKPSELKGISSMPNDFLKLLELMVTEQPLVGVVDGTPMPSYEGYARYPGAVFTYCNMVRTINHAIAGTPEAHIAGGAELPLPYTFKCVALNLTLADRRNFFEQIREYCTASKQLAGSAIRPYEVSFWNPDGFEGIVHLPGFSVATYPSVAIQEIAGPAVVFVNSTAHEKSQIFKQHGLAGAHWPAYFSNQIQELKTGRWGEITGLEENLAARAAKYIPERSPANA